MIGTTLLAAVLYLLPIAAVIALRDRDDRSIWEIAADIPAAVAADLLLVLLLSRFMILETAALVSRGIWIAATTAVVALRRRRGHPLRWPRAIPRGAAVQMGVLAGLALVASLALSRPCAIWDREWHIPLVASLRGQRLPFMNVFEPGGGLYYHFTGDVLAAMLQAFSGNALHASLALSLAHDLIFVLLGAELGLLLWAVGLKRLTLAALALAATLLAGPVTLLREPGRKLESGHSIVNFLSLSFRPHASLSYLFIIGFAGVVVAATIDRVPLLSRRLRPALAILVAALALTDEASLALLALGLAALWLADPAVLGLDRRRGALLGLGLAAVVVVTSLLFVGALGLHAPRHAISLVGFRSPGFLTPAVPFTTWDGPALVGQDLWSILLVGAAGIGLLPALERSRRLSVLFYGVGLVAALLLFCCVEIDHAPIESHRWVTLPFIVAPLLATVWLVEAARTRGPAAVAGSWPALVVYVALGLGTISTVEWLASGVALRECRRHQNFDGHAAGARFYDVSCRALAGATLGEATRVTYVEPTGAYLYAGCRPTFISGPPSSLHVVKVGRPQFGRGALDDIDRNMLPTGAPLEVACLAETPSGDLVCGHDRGRGTPATAGSTFETRTLSAAERARLLGRPSR
jgi:hypothetical protein